MADTQITGTLSADEPISGGLSANEGINAELTSNEEISGTLEVRRTQEIIQAVWGTITGTLSDQADLQDALDGKADLENGKVPSSQLPSYVDDVLEYASLSVFPATGEAGKIYIALDTNKTYRWSGSTYVEISESLALGETTGTAYEGSKGKANADAIAKAYKTDDSAETDLQDADYIPFYDTSATGKRKTLWSNIKAKLNDLFFRRSEQAVLGAKNLLPLVNLGTTGDIEWTIEDGKVIANGSAGSSNSTITLEIPSDLSGDFYFCGCPSGGGQPYDLYPWDSTTSARPKRWDGTTNAATDSGDGTLKEVQIPSGHTCRLVCRIYAGNTVSNLVFKPILQLATDTDNTFVPFAMTNKELTDKVNDAENQLAVTVTEENLRDTVGWTCKNLIALPPVGTVQETNGITFTVRSDGGVSVVGTSTANTPFYLATDKLYAGEYTASCIFDGTPDGQYPVFAQNLFEQDGTRKELDYLTITNTRPNERTKPVEGTDYLGNICIYVANGKTVNQILYPMIRKASVKDSTFEPYHGTVDEVKADKSSLATVATSGSYNDLEDTPTIPDELSDLSDDETHRLVTDTEKSTWDGKQDELTFDNIPRANSSNPVKSGGIYTTFELLQTSKADNSVIAPVEGGTTASRAYAVNEHFIKDGAFCTAKTAIAQGATFTLDTNYTADTIATKAVFRDTVSTGTITLKSGITGNLQNTSCYKKNGMVFIGGRLNGTSTSADKAIFNVPAGFRPASNTWGMGGVYINSYQVGSTVVRTSGDIEYAISSSNATMFLFEFCYPAAD